MDHPLENRLASGAPVAADRVLHRARPGCRQSLENRLASGGPVAADRLLHRARPGCHQSLENRLASGDGAGLARYGAVTTTGRDTSARRSRGSAQSR
jgi:hypothetical protein